jgi:hypothetical protein
MWPTWQQGAALALVCVLGVVALRGRPPSPGRDVAMPVLREVALLAGLYAVWRIARTLPFATEDGAIGRARRIDDLQKWLHLPTELSLQHFALDHEAVGRLLNWYYAIVHVPATLAFLVWLFVRHRDVYPRWRNALAMVTAACLIIRFERVAPPRFLTDLGYVDLATTFGWSVYGPVGTGVSDQFAAMPSIHVGWAAVVAFGVVAASTSRWRWLALGHLVLTMLAVSATGNHWWMDGLVAVALLAVALWVDTRVFASRRTRREAAVEPVEDRADETEVGESLTSM